MKRLMFGSAVVAALVLGACGSDDDGGGGPQGFPQPAGTVAVNFGPVDDTVNKVFTAGQLKWKGSMTYDETTRKITYDGTWGGGTGLQWAPLYDDGPWTSGGHEPANQVANDNKWSVTVFATPPATGSQLYEYGLIDVVYETTFGNGWIWKGANGSFTVNAGQTTAINAPGMTLTAFGNRDMKLTLDKNNLGTGTWTVPPVKIKGSAWAWGEITLNDDGTKGDAASGDGIYTLELSQYVGAGKQFIHSGLLNAGDQPEFIWVLNGVEYKDAGVAQTTGVAAQVKIGAGAYATVTVDLAANNNTRITVP